MLKDSDLCPVYLNVITSYWFKNDIDCSTQILMALAPLLDHLITKF